jgi:hypothetical protein
LLFITKGPYWAIGSLQRPAGDEDGRAPSAPAVQHHAVAAGGVGQDGHALAPHGWFGRCRQVAAVDVDKGVVVGGQRLLEGGAGLQVQVQVQRLGGLALHGACTPWRWPAITRTVTPGPCHSGISALGDVAVPGLAHLVARRQVQPELEAFHAAVFLLGHLAVDDAAAGGHPLHAAGHQQAFVAGAVAVAHAALSM